MKNSLCGGEAWAQWACVSREKKPQEMVLFLHPALGAFFNYYPIVRELALYHD
jgi:hypothetical protein